MIRCKNSLQDTAAIFCWRFIVAMPIATLSEHVQRRVRSGTQTGSVRAIGSFNAVFAVPERNAPVFDCDTFRHQRSRNGTLRLSKTLTLDTTIN